LPRDQGDPGISLPGIDNHLDQAADGDGAVLEAARGGDRNALETLVTAHYDRVHALCRRMLGNDADALDATQDALVSAIRALSRFDGRSSFGTWMYRIATNTCLDELRRRRRRPVTGVGADIAEMADDSGSGPPGLFVVPTPRRASGRPGTRAVDGATSRDPADVVAARLDIDAALAGLPVEFRTAVVLRDVCDLPYDDIAAILGVPVGTVRSRIARARSALASVWETPHGATSVATSSPAAGNPTAPPDVQEDDTDPTGVPDASPEGEPQEDQEEERTR